MSSIYITEPTTKGKVIIKTTLGDIDIELWPKETPKACRNFVQLCMEGYYNGTIFHRVVKGFIAQGGDPTGTGDGGESIYGQPFTDEYHSRIRFSHRGMVAMANSGPNTNQSQFFITMDKAPELQGKYTIFGKVTGDSLFNVLKMNDLQVDDNDRPLYPAKIESVSIVWNPFEDIVPRQAKKKVEEVVPEKPKTKAQKNYSLLSFGEEAEEEDKELEKTLQNTVAVKSMHAFSNREEERLTAEQLEKKQLDEKLRKQKGKESKGQPVSEAAEKLKKNTMDAIKRARDTEEASKDEDFQKSMREKMLQKRRRLEKAISEGQEDQEEEAEEEEASSSEHEVEAPVVVKNADKLKAIKEQQDKLKQEIKKMGQKDKEDQDEEPKTSLIDEQREKYKHMKLYKGRKPDESKVMQMLEKFKQGLHSTSTPSSKSDDSKKSKTSEPVDDDEHEFNSEEDNDDSWKNHTLTFEKEKRAKDPFRAAEEIDQYTVIDPLKYSKVKPLSQHQRRLRGDKKVDEW